MNQFEPGTQSIQPISQEMLQNLIDLEESLESKAPIDLGPSIIQIPHDGTRVVTIAVVTTVFMLALHLAGALMVPGYENFMAMHTLSLAVAASTMVFLSLMSVHAKMVRDAV